MVSTCVGVSSLVVGEVKTDSKSNEITAIQELLKLIAIKNIVVSFDSMGCQGSIAAEIVDRGGDYLLTVKDNRNACSVSMSFFVLTTS